MSKLLPVIHVQTFEEVEEVIKKSSRRDYARGGFRKQETILRTTTSTTRALLSCGHWRDQYHSGALVSKAKKLACWECESLKYEATKTQPQDEQQLPVTAAEA